MAKWSKEDKLRALAIAEASSMSEAEKQTGIPKGTIGRWASQMKQRNGTTETKRDAKRIHDLAEEAIEEAKIEVREFVVNRVKQASEGLIGLVELATKEASDLIATGHDKDNDTKSQWLKAVIGAIAQGVEKHQLLDGKPTSRQEVQGEVTESHEYSITHRIEEYTDIYSKVAGRSTIASVDALDGVGESVHTPRSDDKASRIPPN